jgi:hypothetical protein
VNTPEPRMKHDLKDCPECGGIAIKDLTIGDVECVVCAFLWHEAPEVEGGEDEKPKAIRCGREEV